MPVFYGAIDLSQNELRNARVQNLGTAPSTPVTGQLWYDSTNQILKWWNGSTWVPAMSGGSLTPASTVTTQAVGDAPVVGTSANYAREDHKHGREAFGAITAETTFGGSSANGSAATIARSDHTHGNPVHDAAAHSTIPLSALAVPTGPVSFNGQRITNVADPTAATDAANKQYVDNSIAGLSWKDSVRLASTANVNQSGLVTVDGVTVAQGDRILCKDQTTGSQNGIWIVANAGPWSRATDADVGSELVGAAVFVESGTVNQDTAWVCSSPNTIVIGTDTPVFTQFAGGGAVTAGAGMTQSGNTLNVIGDASITVTADQISRAALTGDVTASAGANATTIANLAVTTAKIANDAVDNTKLSNMVASTIKGRLSAGTGDPEDLTPTMVAQILAGYVPRTWAATLTTSATSYTMTHNFGTQDVHVTVYRATTPWDTIYPDVERTADGLSVILRFNTAPAANAYRVVVTG